MCDTMLHASGNILGSEGFCDDENAFAADFCETEEFMRKLRDLLEFVLPRYREEGKTVLVIAIGCTGGHHRSVAVTRNLAQYISSLGYRVTENHRDMTRN